MIFIELKDNIGIKKHVSVVEVDKDNIAVEIVCNFECKKEKYLQSWVMIDEKLWEIEKILLHNQPPAICRESSMGYIDEIISICNKLLPFVDDGLAIHLEKILELAERIKEKQEG